jgi:hypothetical protein
VRNCLRQSECQYVTSDALQVIEEAGLSLRLAPVYESGQQQIHVDGQPIADKLSRL